MRRGILLIMGLLSVATTLGNELEKSFIDKLKSESYKASVLILYDELREKGLTHQKTLQYIQKATDISVMCQMDMMRALPKPLTTEIYELVSKGKTVRESNKIAIQNYREQYIKKNGEDAYFKHYEPYYKDWEKCMYVNAIRVDDFR